MAVEGTGLLSRLGWARRPVANQSAPALRVRVSVVVVRGDTILLIRHRRDARFYWVLPGGGPETGETLTAAAAREVQEETGLHVRIPRLLYVAEVVSPSPETHRLNLVFLGAESDAEQRLRPSRQWQMEEPHFLPWDDLAAIDLYPPIASELLEDAVAGWQGPIRYLGDRWRNMDEELEWRSVDSRRRRAERPPAV